MNIFKDIIKALKHDKSFLQVVDEIKEEADKVQPLTDEQSQQLKGIKQDLEKISFLEKVEKDLGHPAKFRRAD